MREKKIAWIIVFNLLIIGSEVVFGLIANSFALIADALHNAGDVLAVGVTWLALRLGSAAPTFRRTFGYARAEMMAAFVNTLFLFGTMLYLMYEALIRLGAPEVIDPLYMIAVGSVAAVANGVSAWMLKGLGISHCDHGEDDHVHVHDHDHGDANIHSAYLHMLSDALISVGVIVAGVFIYFFGIYSIDAVLTIVFSIYILFHSYPLLRKSFLALMDINTLSVPQEQIDRIIAEHDEVVEYHDLHVTVPSSQNRLISLHLVFRDETRPLKFFEGITETIRHQLEHLGFTHVLIQSESAKYAVNHPYCTGAHHVSV